VKGPPVSVQAELTTREYDRIIKLPTGKGESIKHTVQQLIVELKANTIRTLDRFTASGQQSDAAERTVDEVPY
jgi:single-strand DNA-binding protein